MPRAAAQIDAEKCAWNNACSRTAPVRSAPRPSHPLRRRRASCGEEGWGGCSRGRVKREAPMKKRVCERRIWTCGVNLVGRRGRERKRLRVIEKSERSIVGGGNGRWKGEIRKEKLRGDGFVNCKERKEADRKKFCNFWMIWRKGNIIGKMEILLESRKWRQKKEIEKRCKRGEMKTERKLYRTQNNIR